MKQYVRTRTGVLIALLLATSVGCSRPPMPDETEARRAVDRHYDETPLSICFDPGRVAQHFAFDGSASADLNTYNRLRSLAWVGLLRERRTENRPAENGEPNPYRGRTSESGFLATDSGRHYAMPENDPSPKRFCYGRARLREVESFTAAPLEGIGIYVMRYTYGVTDVARWALDGSVQAAYPEITRMLIGIPSQESVARLKWNGRGFDFFSDGESAEVASSQG